MRSERLVCHFIGTGHALPASSTRLAFKRPNNLTCNPPSIKIPRLRLHLLAIHIAGVHLAGIEGDIAGERLVGVGWLAIIPGPVGEGSLSDLDCVVGGAALPFAECRVSRRDEVCGELHIFRWDIVDRRVAGLQDTFGATRICDDDAIQDGLDMPAAVL